MVSTTAFKMVYSQAGGVGANHCFHMQFHTESELIQQQLAELFLTTCYSSALCQFGRLENTRDLTDSIIQNRSNL